MREAPLKAGRCWRQLAIVAKVLAERQDKTEIGWVRDVALRTIAVVAGADISEPQARLRRAAKGRSSEHGR